MNTKFFDQVRQSLVTKRTQLTDWLQSASPQKKQVNLGAAGELAIQNHLRVLDTTLAKVDEGVLGVCTVCQGHVETDLLEMDYTTCVCLEHLSPEQARALESELQLAQGVQRSLLPQQPPTVPSLNIAAFSRPAQIVGGDYFDFFQFRNGAQGFVIADVEGHGISASLNMAAVQALLRALVPSSISPAEVVRQLHHLLIHNIRFSTFVTLFIGAFDPASQRLTYCNAGHNPPLVWPHGKDQAQWLRPTGAAVGLSEQSEFGESSYALNTGDVLLLYTDGVTEAINVHGEEFRSERLAHLVRQNASLPAKNLLQNIRNGLQAFTGEKPLADDTTMVVCKIVD